jgi:uncharacterized protein (TIGR02453 family)
MDFEALVAFLSELAQNNNRAWFNEHRPAYERLRREFAGFVGEVIDGIAAFDPTVAVVEPPDAMFRINRDLRFSPDKRPYNTTFSAGICGQGRSSNQPLYYFHITEAGVLLLAGGLYSPDSRQLALIRRHIVEEPVRLAVVLENPAFVATFGRLIGERLKRPPQGFTESDPYIEIIKLKSFTAWCEPEGWLARFATLAGEMATVFRALYPLILWLRDALSGGPE